MINPAICKKCPNCDEYYCLARDEDEKLESTPVINCAMVSWVLSCDSEIPKGCPYHLEHTLLKEETEDMLDGWATEEKEELQNG